MVNCGVSVAFVFVITNVSSFSLLQKELLMQLGVKIYDLVLFRAKLKFEFFTSHVDYLFIY